jgi:hypothetical protein
MPLYTVIYVRVDSAIINIRLVLVTFFLVSNMLKSCNKKQFFLITIEFEPNQIYYRFLSQDKKCLI